MRDYDRRKRVTDPLDDRVKALLVGRDNSGLSYFSSGSEHSATANDDSPCLSELVIGFLEEDQQVLSEIQDNESDSERVDSTSCCTDAIESILRPATSGIVELIQTHVSEAVKLLSDQRSKKSIFRRSVMLFLRGLGHNAGICKTKWDSSGGVASGNYEFIDVIVSSKHSSTLTRYFIDLEFASEFEIARPSSQYSKFLQSLPRIFVGNAEELKRSVRSISDAAKKSLKSAELSMPPWRKNRYMQNKWFGSYRRTTSPIAENPFSPINDPVSGIKCRLIGFHDAVSVSAVNGRPVVRTR